MKVTKSGKVKLDHHEVRIGNFFIKRDDSQMKLTDLNGVFHHAVNRRMPIGVWLENMWERAYKGDEGAVNTLQVYIAATWSLFSVAPDDQFISDIIETAKAALERHPEWYGLKKNPTEDEDAEALKSVEEMKQFEEEVKNLDKKEDAGE